jgi:hypothetical protein
MVFTDWRAPATDVLLGSSPARFDITSWELDPCLAIPSTITDPDLGRIDRMGTLKFITARIT